MDKDDKTGIIYLLIFTGFMITVTIHLQSFTPDQLREKIIFVIPFALIGFLVHFMIRMELLKNNLAKYKINYPIELDINSTKLMIKTFHIGVFFAAELFGIATLAMSVIIIGFDMMDENFVKLQFWDYFANYWVFPLLGQVIPLLFKMDHKDDMKSKEEAGLYPVQYY